MATEEKEDARGGSKMLLTFMRNFPFYRNLPQVLSVFPRSSLSLALLLVVSLTVSVGTLLVLLNCTSHRNSGSRLYFLSLFQFNKFKKLNVL